MKDTTGLLLNLRNLFAQENISAYIVPTEDAHQSEYICPRDERRSYICGFEGSAGTAVITKTQALLWTDGRYYQQALKQLDGNWTLMKDGLPTTPSIGSWLSKQLEPGHRVGVDSKLLPHRAWSLIQKELRSSECDLVPVEKNLVDLIWDNQPETPGKPIFSLDLMFCGESVQEKWDKVKKEMTEKRTDALVVSALDEIAWFLNLRGSDIDYNPVFMSYLIITQDSIDLFVDKKQLPENWDNYQKENKVTINVFPYDDIKNGVENVVESTNSKVWIAPTSSFFLTSLIPSNKRQLEITPIAIMKSIKNPTEIEGFVNCHVRDGLALCQYFAWLEKQLEDGVNVDEISGATQLELFRSKQRHYKGLSFATISASGPNGSVIHYHPQPETNRPIIKEEMYLCDSGAQFLDGTTDVTRTFHFGKPTDFQKEAFTRVLKGQIILASTIFPVKVKGQVLDTLARKSLWDIGLDYRHGTGHGVGHFLNVHEGPIGCGFRLMPDDPGLQENMILSNEPGYYADGQFGIRIEDLVQIVPASNVKYNFNGLGALTFKTITMCPKQTKLIKKELLTANEIQILNGYHKQVRETLLPLLQAENDSLTIDWLNRETRPI